MLAQLCGTAWAYLLLISSTDTAAQTDGTEQQPAWKGCQELLRSTQMTNKLPEHTPL